MDSTAIYTELFDQENIPWLLDVLKDDILEVKNDKVTKQQFNQVREGEGRNAFWKAVSSIAVEKFNMKEVFNMNSTVRLAAIEKLGMEFTWLGVFLEDTVHHI
jgi:hypothetical protein